MSKRRLHSHHYLLRFTIKHMPEWSGWDLLRVTVAAWRVRKVGLPWYDMGPAEIEALLDILTAEMRRRVARCLDI